MGRLARRGWYALAARLRRLASRFGTPDQLLVFTGAVDEVASMSVDLPHGIVFEHVDAADVLRSPLRYSSSRSNAENCIAGNGACHVGTLRGEVVFRMWTVPLDATALARLAPAVRGRALFVHECWTHPSARGLGIYPSGLVWLARESAQVADYLVLTITSRNAPAIRAVTKVRLNEAPRIRNASADQLAPSSTEEHAAARGTVTGSTAVSPSALLGIVRDVLELRGGIWVVGTGQSMYPTLRHGEAVALERPRGRLGAGMIVLLEGGGGPVIHRIVSVRPGAVLTRGDAALESDGWRGTDRVLGIAVAKAAVGARLEPASGFRIIGDMTLETRMPGMTALMPTLRFGPAAYLRYVRDGAALRLRRLVLRRARTRPATRGATPLIDGVSSPVAGQRK